MLVLKRKLGESIRIGPDIIITIVDVDRGSVRVGIDCPREIPIYRTELLPDVQASIAARAAAEPTGVMTDAD